MSTQRAFEQIVGDALYLFKHESVRNITISPLT